MSNETKETLNKEKKKKRKKKKRPLTVNKRKGSHRECERK